jgi:hypothetical protein
MCSADRDAQVSPGDELLRDHGVGVRVLPGVRDGAGDPVPLADQQGALAAGRVGRLDHQRQPQSVRTRGHPSGLAGLDPAVPGQAEPAGERVPAGQAGVAGARHDAGRQGRPERLGDRGRIPGGDLEGPVGEGGGRVVARRAAGAGRGVRDPGVRRGHLRREPGREHRRPGALAHLRQLGRRARGERAGRGRSGATAGSGRGAGRRTALVRRQERGPVALPGDPLRRRPR